MQGEYTSMCTCHRGNSVLIVADPRQILVPSTNGLIQEGKMDKTAQEYNQELYVEIRRLGYKQNRPKLGQSDCDFGYERHWDEDTTWISDNLTIYRGDQCYETTMSPEKFMNMSDQGKIDFLKYLEKDVESSCEM